jgi:hypothetical protein
MFANPTQLPTVVRKRCGLFADVATLRIKSSASSSSLQAQLILVLTYKAQRPAVLRVARNWEGHKQQARCPESNRR